MTADLAGALAEALGDRVERLEAVSGGSLAAAYRADLADRGAAFVKAGSDAASGAYEAEAAGLRWLAEATAGPPVPEVLAVADRDDAPRFLCLEWVEPGAPAPEGEEDLGRRLAALHGTGAPAFGTTPPGTPGGGAGGLPPLRIGPLVLPNEPADGWGRFYAESRLMATARLADERGALPSGTIGALERLCSRIDDLAGPPEPPARLHGDLWGGNLHWDRGGRAWLIDPAAHGGHREIDLAMLELFGGPGAAFLDAYTEAAPLAPGYPERRELWQLFPLLVHAALFGGGYGARASAVLERYSPR